MSLVSPLRLKVLREIVENPGITQRDLSMALYGVPYHQAVGAECRHLLTLKIIQATGRGSAQNPNRYYPNPEYSCREMAVVKEE